MKARTAASAAAGAAVGSPGGAAASDAAAGAAASAAADCSDGARGAAGPAPAAGDGDGGTSSAEDSRCDDDDGLRREVRRIHHTAGHPGIRRTFFFVRRAALDVPKSFVRDVVSTCETCRSIDPAPVKWKKGDLTVKSVWERVAMDITHFRGETYLTRLRLSRLRPSTALSTAVFWTSSAGTESTSGGSLRG